MPIFEYGPIDMDNSNTCCHFETLQKHNEPALEFCPTCARPVKKKLSLFSSTGVTSSPPPLGSQNASAEGRQPIRISTASNSAQRVSQLAMGHVCSARCKH